LRGFPTPCSSTCSPRRQAAEACLPHSSAPARAHPFPQRVWITRWHKRQCWPSPSRRGLPGSRQGAVLTIAAILWRSAVAGVRGSRTSGFQGIPGRAVVSGPAGTALRRQGHSVARAKGPTPPSSAAAPSVTPPRRCLRGVPAIQGLRTSCHSGTPVCAAAHGPVSVAAETAPPLHCPRVCWAARPCSGPPPARQRLE
jgi:hypothetical protein